MQNREMRYAAFASLLALSGCSTMTPAACAGANWYELGERHGLSGGPPRIETYAYQCSKHQIQVPAAEYLEGWWVGNATYRERTGGSADD